MGTSRATIAAAIAALAVASCAADRAMSDREFAARLWQALVAARMVGEEAVRVRPYEAGQPHGSFVDFQERDIAVAGRAARVIVKRNYDGPGAEVRSIWADPGRYLVGITVMFRRERGYDPATGHWFWAKYRPSGEIEAAGRVGECISCHGRAKSNDYILSFSQSR